MKLILASNSPRRRELLKEFGFEFSVIVSEYEEKNFTATPQEIVKTFALGKAKSVFENYRAGQEDIIVLGADTVVALNGQILGKPRDRKDAINMLKSLSGKTHQVYTGYAIVGAGIEQVFVDQTEVVFNTLSEGIIEEYVATGKPLDKAGAYGIQDGFPLVKEFRGSFNNVVGLPIEKFEELLKKLLDK